MIVLGKKLFPRLISRLGRGTPQSFRRPFVVAERHADWGADLAARAGASTMTVNLIRRHQDFPTNGDPLLLALQAADGEN